MRRLRRFLPSREALEQNRLLRPFAPLLAGAHLWHFNRRAVARGVAVGLFFGFLVPVAQILFAAVAAVGLRANVPIAALATLITNPLTFPPIYFAAYRLGGWLLGRNGSDAAATVAARAASADGAWLTRAAEWVSSVGPSLALGLLIMAVASAAAGYVAVHIGWRTAVVLRRRRLV